jgi:hypothetical protein
VCGTCFFFFFFSFVVVVCSFLPLYSTLYVWCIACCLLLAACCLLLVHTINTCLTSFYILFAKLATNTTTSRDAFGASAGARIRARGT